MKRARYAPELMGLAMVAVMVLSLIEGAQIYRWEAYVWLAVVAGWILIAGGRSWLISSWIEIAAMWHKTCDLRGEFIDRLLDEAGQARRNAGESAPGQDQQEGMI